MPGLDSHHDGPMLEPEDDNSGKRLLIIGAVAALAVALAGGAYLWVEMKKPAPAPPPVASRPAQQAAPAQRPAAPPSAQQVVNQPPTNRPALATPPAPARATPPPVRPVPPARQQVAAAQAQAARPQQPAAARAANPEVSALYAANDRQETERPEPQPTPTVRTRPQPAPQPPQAVPQQRPPVQQERVAQQQAPQPADNQPATESPFKSSGETISQAEPVRQTPQKPRGQGQDRPPHPMLQDFTQIGTIRSLPWTVQEKIPSLTYSQHNYKPNEEGDVELNGVTYKKGAQIAPNLKLETVVYDGILLRYGEDVFKLQALSSWVNM